MLKHWLIDLIGHVSGLSDAQLRQIEKSLPATKALIDLLNRAPPYSAGLALLVVASRAICARPAPRRPLPHGILGGPVPRGF